MPTYEFDLLLLSVLLALIFGFIALFASTKMQDNSKSKLFNYKRNLLLIGYLLIIGAILQVVGLFILSKGL